MADQFRKYLDEVSARIGNTSSVIPAQRTAFRKGYSFSCQPFESQLAIWNYIWKHTDVYLIRVHAFFFLEQFVRRKELHDALWHTSVSWQEDVNDWGLCDALAKVNTRALESYPEAVYRQLASWNKDANLWKRRQSVVSLLYYSRTKKNFLPYEHINALVGPLLADKEYYVQKGVGWALRELHNVYPAQALPYLREQIKSISAIAFTTAIEKIDDLEKQQLKSLRKK